MEASAWDPAKVRHWLERRAAAARLDQAAADRHGYPAQDDHDLAAAEEYVCRTLLSDAAADAQASLAARIKALLAQDDYPVTGVNDDVRFERHVRAQLRRVAKMVKANQGFERTARYQ